METKKALKSPPKFYCKTCDYTTSHQRDFLRHQTTAKHKKGLFGNTMETEKSPQHICCNDDLTCTHCGNKYQSRSGYWKHVKKCQPIEPYVTIVAEKPEPAINSNSIIEIIKQNQEFKEMIVEQNHKIMELSNKVSVVNNKTTNNITNNNQFNLNLFLNETCKDAINIQEFIRDLQIQMKELENVAKNGYVSGITDIILSRLKQLDISKRPVHCTDLKREVLYIRDENEWNKDNDEKSKLKNMIGQIANKNYRKIPEWREQNPECQNTETQQYEFCIQMMRNSLGEIGEEQDKLDEKIIKNIAKQVVVDKTT